MDWDPEYLAAIEREQCRLIDEAITRAIGGIPEYVRTRPLIESEADRILIQRLAAKGCYDVVAA